ncbi:MAG: SMP-30/gluconolactonase/LRE family protein [Deltaproteobacteria bacterium]|nr:SMP-30/gluconolactonase/LRE family protein [Deltaproteobacteria bacterium]
MARTLTPLLEGLAFPEGPRWHDGRLWFSDMHARTVLTVTPAGKTEEILRVEERPSGLGWLPDGRLLVVSMHDRRLLRVEPDGTRVVHADLSSLARHHCNDLVVDAHGHAFVGNFGFDLDAGATPTTTALLRVDPDGSAHVASADMSFPNGAVITPDGETLIVAETFGSCLSAFDLASDGILSNRRVWAQLEKAVPDGICLDAEGAIWVASPTSKEILRVREGGNVTERIPTDQMAIACMLGGEERRTLFILTSESVSPEECEVSRDARILTTEVEVPGAGLP